MNDDERDQLLAELIERPQDRERIMHDTRLSVRDRDDLTALVDAADELWLSAQSAPALEDDPVAAILGLVPESDCRLESVSLARARKRARLSVSDLADHLRQRGWEFDKSDVFRWENRTAVDVPPAVVQAISDILDAPVDGLISAVVSKSLPEQLTAALKHPLFEQLAHRWAEAQRVSYGVAAAMLEGRMLATVHRGEQPDAEQLLRSLDALVSSIERSGQE